MKKIGLILLIGIIIYLLLNKFKTEEPQEELIRRDVNDPSGFTAEEAVLNEELTQNPNTPNPFGKKKFGFKK